ncbi:MAG: hypothetical protein MN733_08010, partial [Nitrososphaera sp.]|nr:hypothetical protein [Nitrososphaera sp.]
MDGKSFLDFAKREAARYDIVHVHSLYKIIPDLRKKYPGKNLIIHYHGSEVRKNESEASRADAEEKADAVVGATADLGAFVKSGMIHVPNPVDTDHFRANDFSTGECGKAFTIRATHADTEWTIELLKRNGINLQVDVLDRQSKPVPYSQMPSLLKSYEIYVDLKFIDDTLLSAPSKTGLEALACGLKVLNHELKYVEGLPKQHRPEIVASKLLDIYSSLRR